MERTTPFEFTEEQEAFRTLPRWFLADKPKPSAVREQFGRAIGSFQAVKHMCADARLGPPARR